MTGSELEILLRTRADLGPLEDTQKALSAIKGETASTGDATDDLGRKSTGARIAMSGLSSIANTGRLSFGALAQTIRGVGTTISASFAASAGVVTAAVGAWVLAYTRIKAAYEEGKIQPKPEVDQYRTQIEALTTALDGLAQSHAAAAETAQKDLSLSQSLAAAKRDVAKATLDAQEQLALAAEPDELRRREISLDFDKRRLALTQTGAREEARAAVESSQAKISALDAEIAATKQAALAAAEAARVELLKKAQSLPPEQALDLRDLAGAPGAAERIGAATPEGAALQERRRALERQRSQAARELEIAQTKEQAVVAGEPAPAERIAREKADVARQKQAAAKEAEQAAADRWLDELGAAADADAAREASTQNFLKLKAYNEALIARLVELGLNADAAKAMVETPPPAPSASGLLQTSPGSPSPAQPPSAGSSDAVSAVTATNNALIATIARLRAEAEETKRRVDNTSSRAGNERTYD
jgi:hypothetical protein